jgi:hypothetical protein
VKIYVPLTSSEIEQLRSIAHSEKRRPQDQAAFIIASALSAANSAPTELREMAASPDAGNGRAFSVEEVAHVRAN